ncbi:zymogen granule membrane protein 16-like [Xyrichtys novacula]|uniref:Zymogen granule membrane protein 16-like n=1 Tax=Xyrichtys novacula TaxID=13765 RepID=A0AAV1FMZ1_XYRNO|nr:zymogen granule membrane protein 16-like [Xyrichtys novacula]
MIFVLLFTMLFSTCLAAPTSISPSYSVAVGIGSGTAFATEGKGRITAIRVWEISRSFIGSLQLCYDYICPDKFGNSPGTLQEMELYEDETIVQVSGKHSSYIYQLVFVTSHGRFLSAGNPMGLSFSFFPKDPRAGLLMLSGRYNRYGITSVAAHWGEVVSNINTDGR